MLTFEQASYCILVSTTLQYEEVGEAEEFNCLTSRRGEKIELARLILLEETKQPENTLKRISKSSGSSRISQSCSSRFLIEASKLRGQSTS